MNTSDYKEKKDNTLRNLGLLVGGAGLVGGSILGLRALTKKPPGINSQISSSISKVADSVPVKIGTAPARIGTVQKTVQEPIKRGGELVYVGTPKGSSLTEQARKAVFPPRPPVDELEKIRKAAQKPIRGLLPPAKEVVDSVSSSTPSLTSRAQGGAKTLAQKAQEVTRGIQKQAPQFIENAKGKVQELGAAISDSGMPQRLQEGAKNLAEKAQEVALSIKEQAPQFVEQAKEKTQEIGGAIKTGIEDAKKNVSNWFNRRKRKKTPTDNGQLNLDPLTITVDAETVSTEVNTAAKNAGSRKISRAKAPSVISKKIESLEKKIRATREKIDSLSAIPGGELTRSQKGNLTRQKNQLLKLEQELEELRRQSNNNFSRLLKIAKFSSNKPIKIRG